MATIRTNGSVVSLRLKMGETAIVEFQLEGPGFPAGLPILLDLLGDHLQDSEVSQQLAEQARRAAWELRTIKHQHWLSQFEEIRLRDSQYIDPSSDKH